MLAADRGGHFSSLLAGTVVGLVLTLSLAVFLFSRRAAYRYLKYVPGLLFFFLGVAVYSLHHLEDNMSWPKSKSMWTAVVLDAADKGSVTRCTLQLASDGEVARSHRECVIAYFLKDSCAVALRPAEGVLFYGRVENPRNAGNPCEFDYAGWLKRQDISGSVFVARDWRRLSNKSSQILTDRLPPLTRWRIHCLQIRETLVAHYADFPLDDRERQVLAALTLGEKSQLSHEVRTLYAHAGVSHVLALSGLHLGILVFFLLFLLRPLQRGKGGKIVVSALLLCLIWGFAFLTGMSISLLRASVMYSLFCLLLLHPKVGTGLNNLVLAAFLLLCFQPDALFDVGFQLSFLSVFSILCFTPYYNGRLRPRRKVWNMMTDFIFVAFVAQLATAPLVAYYFNVFPLYFLLGNLVAIPCAYILLILSLLFFLLSFLSPLHLLLARVISFTVQAMDNGLSLVSNIPHAVLALYPTKTETFLLYLLILFFLLYVSYRRVAFLALLSTCCFSLLCVFLYRYRPGRVPSEIVFYNCRGNSAIHFIETASRSWLWCRKPESADELNFIAGRFWKQKNISPPRVFGGNFSCPELKCHDGVLRFQHYALVILQDSRWKLRRASKVVDIDGCYVCKGFRGSLHHISRFFRPSLVVLDASLSEAQRRNLSVECCFLGWRCYDISDRGARTLYTIDNSRRTMYNRLSLFDFS